MYINVVQMNELLNILFYKLLNKYKDNNEFICQLIELTINY